jgi:Flp pilus assembly protein TadD
VSRRKCFPCTVPKQRQRCFSGGTALLGLGQLDLDADQADAAIELLKHATSSAPTLVEAHEQLARAYGQAGDLPHALSELRAAALLKPDDPRLHSALAQRLTATGDLKEATEEQRTALHLSENDADGWNNLGALEARAGRTDAARADFEHALRVQPDHTQAKANLQRLLSQDPKSN